MNPLHGLNPQQRSAVESIEGPLLVLAGAGAGKTKVIIERIKEIIRHGVEPWRILAVTFTNKAAGEMRARISAGEGEGPFISTFHSLGLTLIKENHKLLGYKRTPAIYDRADSLREIKRAVKEKAAEDLEPRMALGAISRQKGDGVGADEYETGARGSRERDIAKVWRAYDAALRADTALDFDDLLVKAVELLEMPEVRARYQRRWRFVHIDEYQDTNRIQARLAGLLVGPERNICVVGDPDQTIYSWRGALIENIDDFEERYPGATVVKLEQNYRSSDAILRAANSLIAHNPDRREKNLFTEAPLGEPLSLYIAGDAGDEALFVACKIKELLKSGARASDFAVLYRANFQSRALEEKLLDQGISHQVLGTKFYERREVKDTLAYLRAALYETPADIARASETPRRGIGKMSLLKMLSGQSAGSKVAEFKQLLARIKERSGLAPAELVKYVVLESGMERLYREDKLEGAERLENLRELATLAERYASAEEFLEAVALASDQDSLKEARDQVRLMTVHAAKGLEFPYVFIVGLEEGLFPYAHEEEGEKGLEEERRLMYVALTRAQRKLYLSYAMMRTMYGTTDMRISSSFLAELPGELLAAETPEALGGRGGAKTSYLDDIDF